MENPVIDSLDDARAYLTEHEVGSALLMIVIAL
jgi:hypothetical protein